MRNRVPITVTVLATLLALAVVEESTAPAASAATPSVTFATAGDFGAAAGTTDYALRSIGAARPAFALALGDLSYELEAPTAWCQRVKDQLNAGAGRAAGDAYGETFPFQVMIGNHDVPTRDEYAACLPDRLGATGGVTLGPAGYPRQFVIDTPAGGPLARVITLGTTTLDSYAAGSPGLAWVASTIDDARSKGIRWVVVAVHENYISVGPNTQQVPASLMDLLLTKKVDLVLQGHDHNYQRSKQLATSARCPTLTAGTVNPACITGDGAAVAGTGTYAKGQGTVVLIVGTGGRSTYPVNATDPEAPYFATWSGRVYGWAKITATPTSLSGSFVGTGGIAYTDNWTINEPATTTPAAPGAPQDLAVDTVTTSGPAGSVALTWAPAPAATGVTGYRVLRGATGTTSTYTVVAVDAAGRLSSPSAAASVTLPVATTSAVFTPTADATVNSGTPTATSGSTDQTPPEKSDPGPPVSKSAPRDTPVRLA